jgi:hypothetical protein
VAPAQPGLAGYIAGWGPPSVSPAGAAFARHVVAACGPGGRERAKNLLWAAGKLADYGIGLGLDPVPPVLLHPPVIERFAAHSPGLTGVTRRTLRTNLRFIARRVVPALDPADASLPRERAKHPYTPPPPPASPAAGAARWAWPRSRSGWPAPSPSATSASSTPGTTGRTKTPDAPPADSPRKPANAAAPHCSASPPPRPNPRRSNTTPSTRHSPPGHNHAAARTPAAAPPQAPTTIGTAGSPDRATPHPQTTSRARSTRDPARCQCHM